MRVLFINTTDTKGGAAIIAMRLMYSLEKYYDVKNFYLVRYQKGTIKSTSTNSSRVGKLLEKIISKITDKLGLQYLFFPISSRNIIRYAKLVKPDVISLHNTHGGYFATPLLEKLSKIAPIVWTLHDMWSFTGNSAHTFGNESWLYMKNDHNLTKIPPTIGLNYGAGLLKLKKRIYGNSDLHIVCPSKWLFQMAKQSPVFSGKQIKQIYNGLDQQVFKKLSKSECRLKHGLPLDGKIVMFAAEKIEAGNPWKGGADLLNILKLMNQFSKDTLSLIVVGDTDNELFNGLSKLHVYGKGYVYDEYIVAELLNAADLFIYPTRADNLPNILIESISCGTPCVTFDIGGNSEIIRNGINGFIIKPFDFPDFANKALLILNDQKIYNEFSSASLNVALRQFKDSDMAKRYFELFNQIVANESYS
ncbi:MAG TPA: glycosyltransferase [Flavisolibacter sp.]|jgi:glycosyltransferase involved in cell wall biosynthesis|nr:glycosyltransferase [Flavisolibacter sp.]